MPGLTVRVLRTPSFAARSHRSRHHRRRLLAVLSGTSIVALSLLVGSPAPAVRADAPPEYYAIALGLTTNVASVAVINESGAMAGTLDDGRMARIDGSTVTPLSGPPYGNVGAITANGTIVGGQNSKAIRVDGTTVTTLPGLGQDYENAYGIDPAGTTIVGVSSLPSGETVAWVDDGSTTTPLPTLGGDYTIANLINGSGLIAGTSRNASGDMHFVTWSGGVIADHGNLGGGQYANVVDMNEAGQVLVAGSTAAGSDRLGVWDGSTLVNVGTLGGFQTYPGAINASGQVVASSADSSQIFHAVSWDGATLTPLGTLGGANSYAGDINDQGQITGQSDTAVSGVTHGFLIDQGVMYDVNDLLPAHSVEVFSAGQITNSGYILAYSRSGPVILVPGPRPAAAYGVVDLGVGLGVDGNHINVTDVNDSDQAVGNIDFQAFMFDGTTAFTLFPGYVSGGARAINNAGQVVGVAQVDDQNAAYMYDGTVHYLGTLGGPGSLVWDINDAGDIIGSADVSPGHGHAFLLRGGTMIDLHTLGGVSSEAVALSETGLIAGYYSPTGGGTRTFISDGTTTTDIGTLGGSFTYPYGINDAGDITGIATLPNGDYTAFLYSDGTMTDINPPGATSSDSVGINDAGVVVGGYNDASGERRGFVYDHGTYSYIPLTYTANPRAINNRGQVVGYENTPTGTRAFVYSEGQIQDLNAAMPLGYEAVAQYPSKIRDDGAVVVYAETGAHRSRALLLVPTTPLPPLPPPPVHATAAHPTVATVTSPNPGAVTVTEAATNDAPPVGSGYTFLGHQLNITAPGSDPAHPISIVVKVDATLLASVDPDLTANDIAVFRNGVLVAGCTSSGADDPATPDPCVSDRTTLSGGSDAGDARITILTSTASHWNVGFVATAPGAPTGAAAVRGDKQATVSWTAPANTGHSPITGYTVTSTPGAKTATVAGSASSAIVTGLTNGTSYTFTVKATNAVGPSPASAPSNAVTPGTLQNQTITFAKPANQLLTTPSITVPTPTASSGLPVTLASTSPAVCSVSGFTINLLAAGTCALTASQAGNGTYKPASLNRTFTISLAPQKITFAKPANVMIWATPLEIVATVDSGLPITLTTSTPAVCVPAGGMYVSFAGPGLCTVTASQPGDATHAAATPVPKSFTVSQGTHTITFPKPAPHTVLDPPFDVTATSSSGQAVTMTSNSTAICTVSGLSVTPVAVGICSLTATIPASFYYAAANPITRTFNITKAPQTITIPDPGSQSLSVHTVVLGPTASSGLTVTLVTQTASVCTVSGNTVTLLKVGVCKVKGTQTGNPVYDPAPAIVRQFNVTT